MANLSAEIKTVKYNNKVNTNNDTNNSNDNNNYNNVYSNQGTSNTTFLTSRQLIHSLKKVRTTG